ncbi:MAG TPA: ATPase domain-containing protein [Nitrososphaeraceae archaeon]|jgi:DNA repair protein RadA
MVFFDINRSRIYASKSRSKVLRISTGSESLDNLLLGGIETNAITEFFGASGTGKTQICHTLAVMAATIDLQNNVIFVDTQGTFRPERLVSIADARDFNSDRILSKIFCINALTSHHQELTIDRTLSNVKKYKNMRLLIVDSAIGNYRAEFVGKHLLSQRQQRLYKFMRKLSTIAKSNKIAVIVTNQVNSGRGHYYMEDNPTGGNIMACTSTYRIHLRRFYNNRVIIVARIVKSSYHPDKEAYFSLGEKGLEDDLQK